MTSRSLLLDRRDKVILDTNRPDPGVWVERLWIIQELSPKARVIRDVGFRRGLNIVCTKPREPGERKTVGHSVGKTLLVRLIRYCLGETHFGTNEERGAIARKWEKAYVLAAIWVDGNPWIVARPMGLETASAAWVVQGTDPAPLFNLKNSQRLKFTEFASVLEHRFASAWEGMLLPQAGRNARWLDLLGWLARDQRCRYSHFNEWRSTELEAGAAQLNLQDSSLVIRLAMDLMDAQERSLRHKHESLLAERSDLEKRSVDLETILDDKRTALIRTLGLDESIRSFPLLVAAAIETVNAKQEAQKRLLEDRRKLFDSQLKGLEEQARSVADQAAILKKTVADHQTSCQSAKDKISQGETQDANTFYANITQQENWCRLFTTKEKAMEEGCPYKDQLLKPGERDPIQTRYVAEWRQRLESFESDLTTSKEDLAAKSSEYDALCASIAQARQDREKTLDGIKSQLAKLAQRTEEAKDLEQRQREFDNTTRKVVRKKREIEDSLAQQTSARKRLQSKLQVLDEAYDLVLRSVLGAQAGGKVAVEFKGLTPKPSKGVAFNGEALGTFASVLGFDLACLLASIQGLGHHPRFLIHDSPREADMEEALYHELFEFIVALESKFGKELPSFQYIITTTTRPPDSMVAKESPWVRLELDARKVEGLLMGGRY